MRDINVVKLGGEERLPCRGQGHVQRSWDGSQQHVFSRNCKVSESENKGELEAGPRELKRACGTE